MAYSEALAQRIRSAMDDQPGITERKMFGGLAFMLNGNMVCGVVKDDLMVRIGVDNYADALTRPGAREMDFTGRPMRGMVMVDGDNLSEDALSDWVADSLRFASTLPAK